MTAQTKSPIWHPFTQHAIQPDMIRIDRTEGAYLYTGDGKPLFDGISSWWVITHGHREPKIVEAIKSEIDTRDQIIFAGFTHPPAEGVANELVKLAPAGLEHVFFSDSGSTAVEVGLKMALGYWAAVNPKRKRIFVMEHSYHGDTIGAMSVGERGVFNAPYEPLLFDVGTVPFPGQEPDKTLQTLKQFCEKDDAAAFIVEPLVLGAGGMMMYEPSLLKAMYEICRAHDVLFIADEVMTGWGRTGSLFACEQAGISPDILCCAKGLTGGLVPLAVTLATPRIFDAHYSTDRRRTFFHSSSFTANPVSCAAALANLKMWSEGGVRERINQLTALQKPRLEALSADKRLINPRQCGTIAAIDFVVPDGGYLSALGPNLQRFFIERGQLIRPLGNTVYLMPPYCATSDDLDAAYDAIAAAANEFC